MGPPLKILVIQLRRIGDIILTIPVVDYLKKAFPTSTVDFLCEPMGKTPLETNSQINRLHLYEKSSPWAQIQKIRSEKYDLIFDFMGNPRSALLTALSGAKWKVGMQRFGRSYSYNCAISDPGILEYNSRRKIRMVQIWMEKNNFPVPDLSLIKPAIHLGETDNKFAQQWLANEGLTERGFVAMAPAHRHKIRQWREEGFRDVALRIGKEHNLPVYLAWGPGEEPLMKKIQQGHPDQIRLLPDTSLRQLGAIFKQAKLVITNDSGLMHIAVSVGAPTTTIYGPTRPIDWNPSLTNESNNGKDVAVTARDVACLGCHLGQCPVGHLCMTHLTADEVYSASRAQLLEEKV